MKYLIITAILIISSVNVNAQGIGQVVPDKPPIIFPPNAFGLDLIFSEGGFGLGTFYRHSISETVTFFTDFSVSEAKDPQEFTYNYIDIFGNYQTSTPGKINRAFIMPLNFGIQYRLFDNVIFDNLRPYVDAAVGPTMVVTDPYNLEFFKAIGKAKARFTLGGYFGIGANFGLDKSSLVGINLRYYIIHFFNQGVNILDNTDGTHLFENDLGGVFITINIGMMY
jgi:hypothetical protein